MSSHFNSRDNQLLEILWGSFSCLKLHWVTDKWLGLIKGQMINLSWDPMFANMMRSFIKEIMFGWKMEFNLYTRKFFSTFKLSFQWHTRFSSLLLLNFPHVIGIKKESPFLYVEQFFIYSYFKWQLTIKKFYLQLSGIGKDIQIFKQKKMLWQYPMSIVKLKRVNTKIIIVNDGWD